MARLQEQSDQSSEKLQKVFSLCPLPAGPISAKDALSMESLGELRRESIRMAIENFDTRDAGSRSRLWKLAVPRVVNINCQAHFAVDHLFRELIVPIEGTKLAASHLAQEESLTSGDHLMRFGILTI